MLSLRTLSGIAMLATASAASAHVSYTNRDIIANGSFDGLSTWTLAGQRVTSNFGWADASDADWGDSHRGRFLKFTISEESMVTINVMAEHGIAGTVDDLVPAFSLYSGVVPSLSYEGANAPGFLANHPGFLPSSPYFEAGVNPVGDKEGVWRTMNDFWMGNDAGDSGELMYVGHALDGSGVDVSGDRVIDIAGAGMADGMTGGTFHLMAGSYTLIVGGGCYACQYSEDASTWLGSRSFSASVTLAPVPEPSTWAMSAAGIVVLSLITRARRDRQGTRPLG